MGEMRNWRLGEIEVKRTEIVGKESGRRMSDWLAIGSCSIELRYWNRI
jgi:hypothetical protein